MFELAFRGWLTPNRLWLAVSKKGLVFLALLFVAGCAQSATTDQPTISPPTVTVSARVSPTVFPSTRVASLSTPTPKPTFPPTSTPNPYLEIRHPTLTELNQYLSQVDEDFYDIEVEEELLPEDVDGDGRPDLIARGVGKHASLAIVYTDISGDQQDDLILFGYRGLLILVWGDTHYLAPFWKPSGWSRSDNPFNDVLFQDRTNDGVPEIIHDYTFASGGTGVQEYYTTRSIIRCQPAVCQSVWEKDFAREIDDSNTGGIFLYQMSFQPSPSLAGQPTLRTIDGGFSIYCCDWWVVNKWSSLDIPSLNILTSTVSLYTWNGQTFELQEEQLASRASSVAGWAVLGATSSAGHQATVVAKPNNALGNANDYCQLRLDGQNIGKQFGCRHNFTRTEWRDITRDGQEEVTIVTYSAGYPFGEEDWLGQEECMHQRFLAYQWDGTKSTLIANIAGCVMDQTLYGVRLEDYDGDGIPEVFAAPMFAAPTEDLPNRIYKWNGKNFGLWSNFPLATSGLISWCSRPFSKSC